jgi:hypothetical protein
MSLQANTSIFWALLLGWAASMYAAFMMGWRTRWFTFRRESAEMLGKRHKSDRQVFELLAHCPDDECSRCAEIICPDRDPFHFHGDGCPSCYSAGRE